MPDLNFNLSMPLNKNIAFHLKKIEFSLPNIALYLA